jgi:hypothetical protein
VKSEEEAGSYGFEEIKYKLMLLLGGGRSSNKCDVTES